MCVWCTMFIYLILTGLSGGGGSRVSPAGLFLSTVLFPRWRLTFGCDVRSCSRCCCCARRWWRRRLARCAAATAAAAASSHSVSAYIYIYTVGHGVSSVIFWLTTTQHASSLLTWADSRLAVDRFLVWIESRLGLEFNALHGLIEIVNCQCYCHTVHTFKFSDIVIILVLTTLYTKVLKTRLRRVKATKAT